MIKAKAWNGKDLKGTWEVTLKIDGVRALWKPTRSQFSRGDVDVTIEGGSWVSRAGKPLYNLPKVRGKALDCEVYLGNFKDTIRATRTQTAKVTGCKLKRCRCAAIYQHPIENTRQVTVGGKPCPHWVEATPVIKPEHLYSLDPLDPRLAYGTMTSPKAASIREVMEGAIKSGYEGLVLRQVAPDGAATWLKVKPEETHDVLVTGAIEGVGKHQGRLGALMTAKGKVGTGFSDEEREILWGGWMNQSEENPIGKTIEVSCMHFTPDGMFRHPRFVRMRPDKNATE